MCGIVGIAAVSCIYTRTWLDGANDSLVHRGPDGFGTYWSTDGRVGFAHRRLSIVDLSAGGAQPMVSIDRKFVITFNGEIYNHSELRIELESAGHKFTSSSDTEVLLCAYRQWGASMLSRLNGMFAFAIHDSEKNIVFFSRDRAGEKPLFLYIGSREVRFASELKALLYDSEMPRTVSNEALDYYLAYGYVPADRCILKGYSKLPAASYGIFDLNNGKWFTSRYWTPPKSSEVASKISDLDLVDQLEQLLDASVRRQLVADVPVGLLLSGGVDSSIVTALASRHVSRVKTFTVGFSDSVNYDESNHAELVARHFDTDHTLLHADDVSTSLFARLVRQVDEPMVDSSIIPTFLVTQQISKHRRVALGGDGADELFGGYFSASRMAWLGRHNFLRARRFSSLLSKIATHYLPAGAYGRMFFQQLGSNVRTGLPPFGGLFDIDLRRRLLRKHSRWVFQAEILRSELIPECSDLIQRITRFDFKNYLAEDILVKVDRASMLNSLEVRSPFLDTEVIDFAFEHVPSRLKANATERKKILRMLTKRLLPREFDQHRKQGFGIPLDDWLRNGPWRTFFFEILFDSGCMFDQGEIKLLFRGLDAGRPVKEHIFSLAMFELWRREYGVSIE